MIWPVIKLRWLAALLLVAGPVALFPAPEPAPENPLKTYLLELDEVGRTLSAWQGDTTRLSSWFFPSYAMLLLRNNGADDRQPYQNLQAVIPDFWQDIQQLNPRYLLELAGGSLAYGDLMQLAEPRRFEQLRTEEQFIKVIAGMTCLRMLEATVGSAAFAEIVHKTLQQQPPSSGISSQLIHEVSRVAGEELGRQFSLALTSGEWMDAALDPVHQRNDSLEISVSYHGVWHFPVDVLVLSEQGDSTRLVYALNRREPLRIKAGNVRRVILDPEHKLAEYYRYNNSWPRLQGNIRIQPLLALPDWETYRITVSPTYWSDWDGDRQFGLKLTSGFGLDLWPAYPSDFRHRLSLELNVRSPYEGVTAWGGRFSWGHTLSRSRRLFAQAQLHAFNEWSGASLGIYKYLGDQRFLLQGSKLKYQRLGLKLEQDYYGNPDIWDEKQQVQAVKADFTKLSLTRYGNRVYLKINAASGQGHGGDFVLIKSQLDLSGVIGGWLVGGVSLVGGQQSVTTPSPYQFTHHYAWQDNLAALPRFRGQTEISDPLQEYLGVSLSAGYWWSWFQIKLFGSSMLYGSEDHALSKDHVRHAAGLGLEHKSFFTAGLYFPVWQSHPEEGQAHWQWRYQWRLSWNL